jgi:hypothetical protein
MALPEQKAQKAFGLRDSRDILEKLTWELGNLFLRQRYDIAVCQYHAFNCAVTAWHVTDWLWQDVESSPALRTRLEKEIGPLKNDKAFQKYVSGECNALILCQQIANGSKHCRLTRGKSDPDVTAEISDLGDPVIVDGKNCYSASVVFHDARIWLAGFIRDWNVFSEEPFVPKGDRY